MLYSNNLCHWDDFRMNFVFDTRARKILKYIKIVTVTNWTIWIEFALNPLQQLGSCYETGIQYHLVHIGLKKT